MTFSCFSGKGRFFALLWLLLCSVLHSSCSAKKAERADSGDTLRFYPLPGVFSQSSLELRMLPSREGQRVIYTTDGTLPLPGKSKEFNGTLLLDSSCVVRARILDPKAGPGPVKTGTFLLREPEDFFPVVAITVNPDSFAAISADFKNDRYIASFFEYFVDMGQRRVAQDCNVRIAGGTSRIFPKKSLKLEALPDHPFSFKFFSGQQYNTFSGLMLRADVTSGLGSTQENLAGERIRNEFAWKLNEEMGASVMMQAWRPVRVFLNGRYHGLYTLMETKGAELIRNRTGDKELDILEGMKPTVVAGDAIAWNQFIAKLNELDPESTEFEQYVRANMDLSSLFDLWILQSFCANFDFEENIRYWRPRKPGGKWHWMAFDFDAWGKAGDNTMTEMLDNDEAFGVFVLGRIVQNKNLKDEFLHRLLNVCNSVFRPEKLEKSLDWVQRQSASELLRDRRRWEGQIRFAAPGADAEKMKSFCAERGKFLVNEAALFFGFESAVGLKISLQPAGGGSLRVNGLLAERLPWTGWMLKGYPVSLDVQPQPGFQLAQWPQGLTGQGNRAEFIPRGETIFNIVLEKK